MIEGTARSHLTDRALGIAYGALTQVLFVVTVWYLFWFLWGDLPSMHAPNLWIDAALALQFAVPHSVLMLPAVKRYLQTLIRPEFYGLFYCVITCVSLLIMFALWQPSPTTLWAFEGSAAAVVRAAFFASWGALFYSLHLTGLGYQTGLTPWIYWLRHQKLPRRDFVPHGVYKWMRHPVYLSFLGLIWFTPRMALDHAVLTGIWTVYIFVGSHLKDERLAYYLGNSYRKYQAAVSGYPLIGFGELGRRPFVEGNELRDTHTALPAIGRGNKRDI